uniref:Uncharacterized protein n=1 Tax=Arundo donax TaxID=35708 RepID=A0A0A9TY14_ARUDO
MGWNLDGLESCWNLVLVLHMLAVAPLSVAIMCMQFQYSIDLMISIISVVYNYFLRIDAITGIWFLFYLN